MKYTEGAFRDWGYEVAKKEFGDKFITEADQFDKFGGKVPNGKIVIKDRIADSMFQQALLRPEEYDVLATPNLNGDYLSDACAASGTQSDCSLTFCPPCGRAGTSRTAAGHHRFAHRRRRIAPL
jgi:hypothetical protein